MDSQNPLLIRPFYISILKGLGTAVIALLIKTAVSFSAWQRYATGSMFGELENYAIYIVCFICSLFVYNSVIGISTTYDPISRDEVMENTHGSRGALPSLKGIFCYRSFFIESATTTGTLTLAALLGASPEIFGMFYTGEGHSPYEAGIFPALVTFPTVLFLCFVARFEAVRYWKYLYRTLNGKQIESKTKLILRVLFVLVLYPIVLPFIPILFYVAVTVWGAIAAAAIAMTIPVFLITLFLAIYGLWWLRVIFAMRKRMKFLGKMKESAEKMRFAVTEIKNPRLSLVSKKLRCSFSLVRENERYDCLVIGNPRYRVPVCFTSESKGHYRHRIGTPKHNITLESKFDYSLNSDNKKILIISPTPKHAFITEGDKEKRLFTADKLWDFVLYESDGFVGALERDCLGRYDSNKF